jgi:hypothetical protein
MKLKLNVSFSKMLMQFDINMQPKIVASAIYK